MVEALMVVGRVVAMIMSSGGGDGGDGGNNEGDGGGAGAGGCSGYAFFFFLFFWVQVCLFPSLSCGLRLTLFGCELFGVE